MIHLIVIVILAHALLLVVLLKQTPSLAGKYVNPIQVGRETEHLGEQQQMKRHGNIWHKVVDLDNIKIAHNFGNLYLNDFDWWIKQEIKPLGYFRYCDDILIIGNSAKDLMEIKQKATNKLKCLGLTVKNNWNIYDIHKNGVDFVGYVFSPQKTKLRKTISNKFKEVCKKIIKNKNIKNPLNSLMAYKGWVKFCNAKALWRKHTTQVISMFPKQIRRAV
jgi:hypothetical protein